MKKRRILDVIAALMGCVVMLYGCNPIEESKELEAERTVTEEMTVVKELTDDPATGDAESGEATEEGVAQEQAENRDVTQEPIEGIEAEQDPVKDAETVQEQKDEEEAQEPARDEGATQEDTEDEDTTEEPVTEDTSTEENPDEKCYVESYALEAFELVNKRRAEYGVPPLEWSESLYESAQIRARELIENCSHTRPNGERCFSVIKVAYQGAGENIAAGQWSPDWVVDSWMNSEEHKKHIIDGRYTQTAIACIYDADSPYEYYWVQIFIG